MWFEEAALLTEEVEEVEYGDVPIRFYNLDAGCYQGLHTCEGDLIVTINAMFDYADLLMETIALSNGESGYRQVFIKLHADRCRKIAQHLQEQIGYDRDAAIERCRKKRRYYGAGGEDDAGDVGEDAMYLALKLRREKSEKGENHE